MVSPMVGLKCMYMYYSNNEFKSGMMEAYYLLLDLDRFTYSYGWNFLVLRSPGEPRQVTLPARPHPPPPAQSSSLYWDIFLSTCQTQGRMALAAGWLQQDDVAAAMPSALTSIPALALLEILAISVDRGQGQQVIYWGREEDAAVCYEHSDMDDVAELFWPQLMKIKTEMEGITTREKEYMLVKVCDVHQITSPGLERRKEEMPPGRVVKLHRVCGQVNSLVLSLLRLRAMRSRLRIISNIQ